MNYMFCIKEESQMKPPGSILLSLSRHRFLAETRSEVSSVVSMTENNTGRANSVMAWQTRGVGKRPFHSHYSRWHNPAAHHRKGCVRWEPQAWRPPGCARVRAWRSSCNNRTHTLWVGGIGLGFSNVLL